MEPCWVFHTLNAHDDDGRVVVNLVRYGAPYDVSALEGKGPLTLERWSIDPAAGTVRPRASTTGRRSSRAWTTRIVSQPHRYGYSAVIGEVSRETVSLSGDFADGAFANALLKHDLAAGTNQAHEFGKDATAGEAVFARPHRMPVRTTATCWPSSTTRSGEPPIWSSWPPRTSPGNRRPASTCRPGYPLGFHGSWIADQ